VLLAAGSVAIGYLPPIVLGFAVLLTILTLSYGRQFMRTHRAVALTSSAKTTRERYRIGGGAALLVAYILTVAVSISAGVAAAAHGTRLEFLQNHRVAIFLLMIALIAVISLRVSGVGRELRWANLPVYSRNAHAYHRRPLQILYQRRGNAPSSF
jgi:hypothetical protein